MKICPKNIACLKQLRSFLHFAGVYVGRKGAWGDVNINSQYTTPQSLPKSFNLSTKSKRRFVILKKQLLYVTVIVN